jgi:spore coat polysaccharide biosynthesis predicted glycosyltransferase SpsG
MKVGLLASTGENVGLGHLKRCLSIAASLKNFSHEIDFIIENIYFNEWIEEYGFPSIKLESCDRNYDLIIIDKYQIDEQFLNGIKMKCRLLAKIDDAFPLYKDHISDVLINCNPYAEKSLYKGLLRNDCTLILGKDFFPMEQKFCRLREQYSIRRSIKSVTLTFGAADNREIVRNICERLNALKKFDNIYILNGEFLNTSFSLSAVSAIKLLPLLKNVEDIFSQSDLVICSASTTCWQLCAIGIPLVCFQTVDNQSHNFNYIKGNGVAVALDMKSLDEGRLEEELSNMDLKKREAFYLRSRQLIDCKGSERIAVRLTELMNSTS